MTPNRKAFLDMLAWSEGTSTIAGSDDGYNVLVGGKLFNNGYIDHPRILVQLQPGLASTAAGRYQLLERYYDIYKKQLGLIDFGHEAQDNIALQQIAECHALSMIDSGQVGAAIAACERIWASLPGNNYGQHENKVDALLAQYNASLSRQVST